MIWRVAALLFLMMLPAYGAPIELRSGEHEDFSRIVMPLPKLDAWALEETEGGFVLDSGIADADFALQQVFRFIPRTRLQAIEARPHGVLFLKTGADIDTRVFTLAPDLLVIDFFEGLPSPPRADEQSPEAAENAGSSSSPTLADDPAAASTRSVQPVAIGGSYLDLFWRDQGGAQTNETPAPATQRNDAAPQPELPREPDPQVAEIEKMLARQLARASAQGLIAVERNDQLLANTSASDPPARGEKPPQSADIEPVAPDLSKLSDHIAFKSTTVIDRDQLHMASPSPLKTGLACAPDSLFDIGRWIDDRDPVEQISDAREALVGEFDIPDQTRVIALARVYIAFGFGAEARALLDDMATPGEARDALHYLGTVLDENPAASHSPFAAMSECDGLVALWSFLGASPAPKKESVNFAALQRAFRALPAPLRKAIAPRLTDRLTEIGAGDVARTLRPALARVTQDDHNALDTMDAHLAVAEGSAAADTKLRALTNQNGPETIQAILLLITHQLEGGGPVDIALIESAESFAFELREGKETGELMRAVALAYAANKDFEKAFKTLDQIDFEGDSAAEAKLRENLTGMLAKDADDATFLRMVYARPELSKLASKEPKLRSEVARRFLDLGMAGPATRMLNSADSFTAEDRLLLGIAALAAFDPAAALAHLNGLKGPEADRLRAEALSRLGQHGAAREAYDRAGEKADAQVEAWRESDWQRAQMTDDSLKRSFVETFGTEPQTAQSESGPLTQARSLLESSRSERQILREMLDQLDRPRAKIPE